MTWSTRELAELAGTTVNTIRHYHALGLLDAPERRGNGYKQYRVCHLVRLIQVRRMAELGVPLARVDVDGDEDVLRGELEELDAQVSAEIDRLRRARTDIETLLTVGAPVDTPRGFEAIAAALSSSDRAYLHILTRLHDDAAGAALRDMILSEPEPLRAAFAALPADAAEDARRDLAARMHADGRPNWRSPERPWLADDDRRRRSTVTRAVIAEALVELYSPAQRDVIARSAAAPEADSSALAGRMSAAGV
ncbi:MerR family transcriptional regulator [Microbacterium sp. NPDC089695]|uniref:MerR family transcriptional regulator n=1 Tax=Microbacterium sp. NPDC089695 TaxID=3364198 RepID=UPI0038054971